MHCTSKSLTAILPPPDTLYGHPLRDTCTARERHLHGSRETLARLTSNTCTAHEPYKHAGRATQTNRCRPVAPTPTDTLHFPLHHKRSYRKTHFLLKFFTSINALINRYLKPSNSDIQQKLVFFSCECFGNSKIVSTFASANEKQRHSPRAETLDKRMARSSIG